MSYFVVRWNDSPRLKVEMVQNFEEFVWPGMDMTSYFVARGIFSSSDAS